jgi:hypothetical protein
MGLSIRLLKPCALAALAASVVGCNPRYVEPTRGGGVVIKSDRLGWYTKKVVTKQAPETLYAEDGTTCRLSPERFRDTAVGALLYCNWQ